MAPRFLFAFLPVLLLYPSLACAQSSQSSDPRVSVAAEDDSASCKAMRAWEAKISRDSEAVEITSWRGLAFDLRYATTRNMAGKALYCGETRVFVHRQLAKKLARAMAIIDSEHPGCKLCIWDATRPRFAQEALRALVRGTPQEAFVSSAQKGSLHNFGMALDLVGLKSNGEPIDRGTDFDDLTTKASAVPAVEDSLVAAGQLTQLQVNNRRVLRSTLARAGFIQLPSEWWHFNAAPSGTVRESMRFLGE